MSKQIQINNVSISVPDNWDDYTEEQKEKYIEKQKKRFLTLDYAKLEESIAAHNPELAEEVLEISDGDAEEDEIDEE